MKKNMLKEKFITLTITNACNLNCTYCYEHNKSTQTMSFDVAVTLLEKELKMNDGTEFMYIDLFGGEPFLEFDLIKKIVSYLKNHNYEKKYIVLASTNGTLVHGEIQKWLIENNDVFKIGLSFDGTPAMHDKNRCNSSKFIDLDFYLKYYSDQPIKMTISQETLPFLAEGVIFCHNKGLKVNCNLAYGIDWSKSDNIKILERELMKLINFYLENPSITPCSMISNEILQIGYDNDTSHIRKWCGVGTNMRTYDTKGICYPCQFFMPLSAGEEKSASAKEIIFLDDIPISYLKEDCQKCPIVAACPFCYGSNYLSTGNIYFCDANLCKLTKVIILARSYYYAKLINLGRINYSENEQQALIRAIVKIQNELKI